MNRRYISLVILDVAPASVSMSCTCTCIFSIYIIQVHVHVLVCITNAWCVEMLGLCTSCRLESQYSLCYGFRGRVSCCLEQGKDCVFSRDLVWVYTSCVWYTQQVHTIVYRYNNYYVCMTLWITCSYKALAVLKTHVQRSASWKNKKADIHVHVYTIVC